MTRGVYIAWLWVLGVALGLCALAATLGSLLRLEGPTAVDCASAPREISGHVSFEGCVVDATDATLFETPAGDERAVVWVVPAQWSGRPLAWMLSADEAHVRWARLRATTDEGERRRYLDRHRAELRIETPIGGWLAAEPPPTDARRHQTIRPAPRLGLERPLEPLSVGGSFAAALLLVLLVALVAHRRRWREEQARWAHARGVALPTRDEGQPTAF